MELNHALLGLLTIAFVGWAGVVYRATRNQAERIHKLDKDIAILQARLDSLCARFERRKPDRRKH